MRFLPLSAMLLAASLMQPSLAHADPKWKHGKGHGKGGHEEHVVIRQPDRVVIHEYLVRHSHCPPGLAKKRTGCRPPGQVRHYVIGQPLPDTVVYEYIPRDLLVQLQPVPVGYRYVRVDDDVLLIAEGSKHVIDAITLFSAVGN